MNSLSDLLKSGIPSLDPYLPEVVVDAYLQRKDAIVKLDAMQKDNRDFIIICVFNKGALVREGANICRFFEIDDVLPSELTRWLQSDDNIQDCMPNSSENTRCLLMHGETSEEMDLSLGGEEEE